MFLGKGFAGTNRERIILAVVLFKAVAAFAVSSTFSQTISFHRDRGTSLLFVFLAFNEEERESMALE